MGIESPIIISSKETNGLFKLQSTKQNLINSCHPTLQQIGQMSQDEVIAITFNNMMGTKVFSIREGSENVRILSKGYEMETPSVGRSIFNQNKEKPVIEEQVVQCEFPYQNGMIIVSSTDWCNLENVESNIDIETMRKYYKETYGNDACNAIDVELAAAPSPVVYRSVTSRIVKEISSGTPNNK